METNNDKERKQRPWLHGHPVFEKGETVEVFSELHKRWVGAVVFRVWKCAKIPEGTRYVEYDVDIAELDGEPWHGRFLADHVRESNGVNSQ